MGARTEPLTEGQGAQMPEHEQVVEHDEAFSTSFVRGRIVPEGPTPFRNTVREVRFDDVRIGVMRSTPARFVRTAADVAATEQHAVTLVVVGEGAFVGTAGAGSYRLAAGEVGVYDTTVAIDLHWPQPIRVLRCTVAAKRLPPYVLAGPPLPVGALPRSALVNSTIAFVSALMADGSVGARTPQLVQAMADLTVDILAEVRGVLAHEPGSTGLRFRIEDHVMAHFGDPTLSPGTIAAALGVSLRSVHHAFEDDEMTVARLIRDRRLESVANELRERHGPVLMADLADRNGFSSRDQLARSFRQRYGSTMRDYRQAAQSG